ncbi:hemin uptake protein HemP [Thalassospira lucentensis]|uniref:Hemin uptake protein HemP n=1 Tax=Thalassospira lucentensis TaxID=168935 RepID=A0A358HMU6_9PROT|nr:hemin uptake protein HemP [Thalassospira lucentensis]HBU96509.1 hemin uptake protein HemP [Thalassospira lucentensis]HCW69804.1 hemin uptake protein HemP [Thalassospira lucentensis]
MPHIAARPSKNDKSGAVKYMQVSELMGDDREIIIIHQGDEYHLRLTSNNKLILTK